MQSGRRLSFRLVRCIAIALLLPMGGSCDAASPLRLARFQVDVTIPLGHRCMGVLPTKSKRILDPLYAHGLVLLSDQPAIVLCAVDWCEIRNGSYDYWRDMLAKAAGTRRQRVLVCALHQHDAPVTDSDAAKLLADVGLRNELYDEAFHNDTVARVAESLKASLSRAQPITHIGVGQAEVKHIASNRRVVRPDGTVGFDRGSRSGGQAFHRDAPLGNIDPYLKTVSFWNGDRPVAAIHSYATHPMSYYGAGDVSADFVGLARDRRQRDDFTIHQIYVSGCSGDVTAGKFNDGSQNSREALTQRLYDGMRAAWQATTKQPIDEYAFRSVPLSLGFHPHESLTEVALKKTLEDSTQSVEDRILAAMGLASRRRVAAGRSIDFPCLSIGPVRLLLFPGESFVAYQKMAQQMAPDKFVFSIGYGECWPGYIPTDAAFADSFHDNWLWAGPGSEPRIKNALRLLLAN